MLAFNFEFEIFPDSEYHTLNDAIVYNDLLN